MLAKIINWILEIPLSMNVRRDTDIWRRRGTTRNNSGADTV
jgi:hypothetical protein